jgi:large subunit ribosomal protein L10
MLKAEKEKIVAELVERLRTADTLLVADYRGLSMPEIDDVRTKLLETGARFSVVKNTLTRIAAETAGVKDLLDLLEGPTAIAFLEPGSDPVAAAKVLNEVARTTRVLAIRGGMMEGRPITEADVKELATMPPLEILRGQVLGAIIAPLTAIMGLVTAPLQNLHGLIDARIEQLGGEGATEEPAAEAAEAPAAAADAPAAEAEAPAAEEPAAAEKPETEAEAEATPVASAEAEDTSAGEDETPAAAEKEEG